MYQLKGLKSITGHLNRPFLVILTIIGLFLFNSVFAGEIFFEDFDPPVWSLHEALNKNGWTRDYVGGNHIWISDVNYYSSPYSAEIYNYAVYGHLDYNPSTTSGNYVEFYFKSTDLDATDHFDIRVYGNPYTGSELIVWLLGEAPNKLYYTLNGVNFFELGDIDSGWNYIKIETNPVEDEWRIKFNDYDLTDWFNTYVGRTFDFIAHFEIGNGNNTFWLDNFILGETGCDFNHLYNCSTLTSCVNAGGFWDTQLQECLPVELTWVCGPDDLLQFCENETDCENNGGHWINDYCWQYQETEFTDFTSYYEQNSSFSEPTIFVSNLASFSWPLIQNVGNFLAIFSSNFSVASASASGNQLGSAIAQARGYLDTINDFFGGLPIGQALSIYLIILLGVGVFRIAVKLFHLARPT